MGNFSGNTFDELNNYVGVRLQQGVPIVDADWNEMEDIRRFELESFLRWFVGDGVPKGSDGFRILPAGTNDFEITDGWCLINGWQINNECSKQKGHPLLYSSQIETAGLPPLTTPGQDRDDLVYLDVWEHEVNDNDNQVYGLIGIFSCMRIKREWLVRVAEGKTDVNQLEPEDKHFYYSLALLHRPAGSETFVYEDSEDLRRTGLTAVSAPLTIKDGNVGIGTTTPKALLAVAGIDSTGGFGVISSSGTTVAGHWTRFRTQLREGYFIEANGQIRVIKKITNNVSMTVDSAFSPDLPSGTSFAISYPALVVPSGNVGIGTADPNYPLSFGNNLANTKLAIWDDGANGRAFGMGVHNSQFRFHLNQPSDRFSFLNGADGDEIVTILGGGNVGIGTMDPKNKLDVEGAAVIGAAYAGTNLAPDNGLLVQGNVGIGMMDPSEKLEVNGTVKASEFVGDGSKLTGDLGRMHKVPLLQQTVFSARRTWPSITVDNRPCEVAFDGTHIWVANYDGNTVSKIDAASNAVAATVSVVGGPIGVAFDGTYIWVTNYDGNTVSKIDAASNAVVATVLVEAGSVGVAFDGTYIWVTNYGGRTVSKIDAASDAVVATVSVGQRPYGVAFDGTHIWVANYHSDNVSKIDAASNAVVATVSVGQGPSRVAFDGTYIWVANTASNNVSKIDAASNAVVATVSVGQVPYGVAFDGTHIWVANSHSDNISKIDAASNAVVATVSVGPGPDGVVFDGTHIWVTHNGSNTAGKIRI